MTRRAAARVALVALAAAAALIALGAPRFTWQNAGLRVDHPPLQGAAALLAAVALLAASPGSRPRVAAFAALAAAVALAVFGCQRLVWRLEAIDSGLSERALIGSTRIPWSEVEAVAPGPGTILVRGRGGSAIAVATRGLAAEDRNRLERTIARRVKETTRQPD